jgi:hypothetical protein
MRGAELAELRAPAHTLAQHIQVLPLQVAEPDGVIEGLREELARSVDARVVPLRRPPHDGAGCEPRIILGSGPGADHGQRPPCSPVEVGGRLWQTQPGPSTLFRTSTENRV